MTRIKIHISNVKLPFYPPCEVKCRLQNRVSTFAPYNNNNVVAMMRKMNYLLGINLGKTVKKATT